VLHMTAGPTLPARKSAKAFADSGQRPVRKLAIAAIVLGWMGVAVRFLMLVSLGFVGL
jgi:hypothetical protein